jgi:hypothetical protein
VDAFTIMNCRTQQHHCFATGYVHPSPEAVERACEGLRLSDTVSRKEPKVLLPPSKIPYSRRCCVYKSLKGL